MIHIDQDRVTQLLLDLVKINSPSHHEAEIAEFLAHTLTDHGFEVRRFDPPQGVEGDTGNLLATYRGEPDIEPVLFAAHMDTIQPTAGINVRIDDGIMHTDGTTVLGADDKAGIAAMIEGVLAIRDSGVRHGDIELLFTVAEETGLYGAKATQPDHVRSRIGYVLDDGKPVGGAVHQAPYHERIHITVHGKAAHAGMCPELGINAIEIAAAAIAGLHTGRIDDETTSNVGVIQGGILTNIVPDACHVTLEARSVRADKLLAEVARLRGAFEHACAERMVKLDCRQVREYNGYIHSPDCRAMTIARRAAEAAGLEFSSRPTGAGTDANVLNTIGIETVVLGTGMCAAHTSDEYIEIRDLANTARLVAAIIQGVGSRV